MSKKLFSQIKGQVHDASGIVSNPHTFYWVQTNGIYYPLFGTDVPELYPRKCDKCGTGFSEGFIVNGGDEYFCSDKCLHSKYTKKEWKAMYGDGDTDSYFSDWDLDLDNEFYDEAGTLISPEDKEGEITLEGVRVLLEGIMQKINENNISLWHDDLQGTSECVILELASKGDDESEDNPRREIKYNGWLDDLINLQNKLK